MIRISQLKLPVGHTEADLLKKSADTLRVSADDIHRIRVVRRSIDARDRENICYVYTVDAEIPGEKKILSRCRGRSNVQQAPQIRYHFPTSGDRQLSGPPIIIGSGPAGIFCAWMLAKHGYRPIVLERGDAADVRRKKIEKFWQGGTLDPESNVQFGEGGAGTFSDGKLNTGVHDRSGRNQEVLRLFVKAGAPEDILWDAKPHVGTDLLVDIVRSLRAQIESFGGSVEFRAKVTGFTISDGRITGVTTEDGRRFVSDAVVLATGHSARDTFVTLSQLGIRMEAKPFAVGLRVQHPQKLINDALYGPDAPAELGAAPYKLTHRASDGRGVYSFCMCPGGYIVNASSEEGRLAVNGMSLHDRASGQANSAIVVAVRPEDYRTYQVPDRDSCLNGIYFQRKLEEKAFRAGGGKIPVQSLEDFRKNTVGSERVWQPCTKGAYEYGDVRGILPAQLSADIEEGMSAFGGIISGFDAPEALFAGVESRTSSPVRILRGENLESPLEGLYPCGEGAGFAGGITSAAIDGIKVAEKIAEKYGPL